MTKRALISVSDKSGVLEFAKELVALGYEVLSTGGTKKHLQDNGVPVTSVDEVTKFPEILGGRVKTLNPMIHGGLLAKYDDAEHQAQMKEHGIEPIEIVCVNLYPFVETISKPDVTFEDAIENIDIGGPTMLRSAAKNQQYVTVIVDANDYEGVLAELKDAGQTTLQTRRRLAAKVFRHTAAYDSYISNYLSAELGEEFPEQMTLTYELKQTLRYGENPHQKAAFYQKRLASDFSVAYAEQLHGKELSYNNIQDANAALQIIKEFKQPAAVAVKHMNPCGVGTGETIAEAFNKAYEADATSIFGGIVALNREVDAKTAEQLASIFLEIIIAPSFSKEAIELLTVKKNIRLLTISFDQHTQDAFNTVSVEGGLLVQEPDRYGFDEADIQVVTDRQPTEEEWAAMRLGWSVVKHVKSNAIVITDEQMTLGIGAGQMNRVGSAKIALEQAGEKAAGAALASDAFFPMPDTVEAAIEAGITAIIHPGGSKRDQESIDAANKAGITMVLTGVRHFKH
ncbi:MAG: bifunctional phosphoribosylaminoimidazolecarboxamide formyltransferase/IMP cyclohydrolase [Kurthia gibsonii]|uniref:bifunctional phosphoribosylaminoimidazolecarboxamide formyltransferase/IMP cyclohydrolase n=1 Tax=Kurthia TaxID=1649 RepID=UPI000745E270|nr:MULTISPECIES: bifunctional phosphoribosylaminoimidazolecarboxamide formyltransferase/IMP cyclohydrolase [Kurthia]AMA63627.1 phosphoribosylaminoimidazolecarboxamide formyltransferase/IMP cyclohydrolase [Kurthia sp. 11kri321]MEB6113890.1 bifunctional phosphoribosylaminoimidazolecarboxamide formyltransferase/IMP cyclohydrolase [Kurthia gibsonii]RXH51701.1 bifunctional phosphoribosylaminoimidazolecarboxamide formyltransferase/IMP cyclohydrolase [Kurthia gibsonii]WIL38212.1 bifunctional phosphori